MTHTVPQTASKAETSAACLTTTLGCIDDLCQIRDELRVIWLALGNETDADHDGIFSPIREHVNSLAQRIDAVGERLQVKGVQEIGGERNG